MSDLKDRLAAARAAKAAIEEARAAREAEQAQARAVEALEREVTELAAVEDAEDKLGREGVAWHRVETVHGLVIVKRADPVRFKRFQDEGKFSVDTLDALGRPCVVYPPAARYDEICELLPALPSLVANAVSELAGVRAKDRAGK